MATLQKYYVPLEQYLAFVVVEMILAVRCK